jgi:GTP cyclohydrolase I
MSMRLSTDGGFHQHMDHNGSREVGDPSAAGPLWSPTAAREKIEGHVRGLLEAIGEDPNREGLRDTPSRVARAWVNELCAGYEQDPVALLRTQWSNDHHELVLVKDIPFYSLCEHHLLPFHGVAHVGYIPDGKIVGISKLSRLVECFSRRLQIQERLVSQIADALNDNLKPLAVGVVIEAEHMCMTMRGVQKPGSKTVTSAMRGLFFYDGRARGEFLQLINVGGVHGISHG